MEIKVYTYRITSALWKCCVMCILFGACIKLSFAQEANTYTIRDGKMYILLNKKISPQALNNFIKKYNLYDLPLRRAISISMDSIKFLGWKVEENSKRSFVFSKPLLGVTNINNPEDKIIFAEKHPTFAELFPAERQGLLYGYNRLKNKFFAANGSEVIFFLRNYFSARKVMLAGSFNEWSPDALAMIKTDSGWIAKVKIKPGKYWYKFIIDGNWITDPDNFLKENDGLGNVNSVFYKTNIIFKLQGFTTARKIYLAGSFNNWQTSFLQMIRGASGWELPLYLSEGTHTYKFIADGNWIVDPGNPNHLPDGNRGFNSVIRIGKPYLFSLNGYQGTKQVVLTGSFNNWRKDELLMNKTISGWEIKYTLGPGNYEYQFLVDGVPTPDPSNPLISHPAKGTGNSYLIIAPNFTFRLKGFAHAKKVFLSGDFVDWSPNTLPMQKQGDDWVFNIHLSIGKHRYKYIVDGKWIIDPSNKLWEQNEYGTGNSIIWTSQ